MSRQCNTCPYAATTGCVFYVLGGNWHCARENIEGQKIANYTSHSFTGNKHEEEKKV